MSRDEAGVEDEEPSSPRDPICQATRWRSSKNCRRVVFFDNRGFSDPISQWEAFFPEVSTTGANVLQKRLHPVPPLEGIDPGFNTPYDESKHAAKLAV